MFWTSPDFPLAAADLEQRVVGGALCVGRIEQQHPAESRSPAGGQAPILTLDVMDDGGARPGQQRRHDQANALAGSGRREAQHMLRAMVAEIGATPEAEKNAIGMKKPRLANLARFGPARGAVGRDLLHFAGAPHRHRDRHHEGRDTARAGDEAARDEDLVGVGVIGEPPPEEGGRLIDRPPEQSEPGMAKLRLEGELPGRPFRRAPYEADDDSTDEKDLAPENFGRVHGDTRSAASRKADASPNCEGSGTWTRWRSNRTVSAAILIVPAPASGRDSTPRSLRAR